MRRSSCSTAMSTGTLGRHGDKFNDLTGGHVDPVFLPRQSKMESLEPGKNRKPGAPDNTGEFHDRFGNKVTIYGAATT